MKAEVYAQITSKIVAELEHGVRPWLKPWSNDHGFGRVIRPLRANGVPYRGINVLLLWSRAMEEGFSASTWITFKQAVELNGTVRKGEKGSLVVYAARVTKEDVDDESSGVTECSFTFLTHYNVFNVEQIDGLPARFYEKTPARLNPEECIERADLFVSTTGAHMRHGGDLAYYSPRADRIQMPPFKSFFDVEAYYATLLHELVHWTGHKSRLNRVLLKSVENNNGWAMEEVVAELGAAFLCADLDITPEPRADHASYIGAWLEVMKGNTRAIFTAAAHAQRAADYLNSLPRGAH